MNSLQDIETFLAGARQGSKRTVAFVSGTFDVLHPGHLRLLHFAKEQADILVVAVHSDKLARGPMIRQDERLRAVQAFSYVDRAFVLVQPLADVLRLLRPDLVIKGREWVQAANIEEDVIKEWGGQMLFSSGEVTSSSFELAWEEFKQREAFTVLPRREYMRRRKITTESLADAMNALEGLSVLVLGDTIVDEYLFCDALGMSQEDPVLVVRPIAEERYIGGAAIVALHARGLGGKVRFASVVGEDADGEWVDRGLIDAGVETRLLRDGTRPTTRKQRYISAGKKLLRVSYLREHALGGDLTRRFANELDDLLDGVNLVIFSDFSYGYLSEEVLNLVLTRCKQRGIVMAADSQSSSQVGDVTRFVGVDILTPTEREARMAVHDRRSGLVVLAQRLQQKTSAKNVVLTLGKDGVLVHKPHAPERAGFETDNLPALNVHAKDVLGAGDSLLVGSSMTLAAGHSIWTAAYIGSLCAAYQVACVGNQPLSRADVAALIQTGEHA